MQLTSALFFTFLTAFGIIYFLVPKKIQWMFLLVGSYTFYLYSDLRLVFYILISTCTSFFGALLIEKQNIATAAAKAASGGDKSSSDADSTLAKRYLLSKKGILILVLVINFAILAYFKHVDAWIGYLNSFFGLTGMDLSIGSINPILPLGISFYTFQSMGYLIDVYRTKIKPDRNIAKFALFISFFPQLIQGPISRHDELAHQFFVGHKFDAIRIKHGILLIFWGLFKKLVIADRVAIIIRAIFDMPGGHPKGVYAIILAVMYSIQIYADFSGGVDIARGAAQILGIDLPQNFLRPYFAKSMPEFWRRWHVTLNNWWRDYIFYPVIFSDLFKKIGRYYRKRQHLKTAKFLPVYVATMVVRVVNALWHGASLKYLANGFYNGAIIILGMQLHDFFMKVAKFFHIKTECFSFDLFRMFRTFCLVSVARLITIAPRFKVSCAMLFSIGGLAIPGYSGGQEFSLHTFLNDTFSIYVWLVLIAAIFVWIAAEIINECDIVIRDFLEKQNMLFQWLLYIALIVSVLVFGIYGPKYAESAFIYQQF